LKEGGVWSLMEAMSMGLPSICVKTSGMEVITDDTSAIRVEPVSQQQMIEDFASALEQLAKSPALRRQLGDNARKRIKEHFLWRHKGEFMASLFDKLEHTAR
jgi:glycosyltransferase involved in cell wall biosynthesis